VSFNLTEKQEELVKWFVQQVRDNNLPEEFSVIWEIGGVGIEGFEGEDHPDITPGTLDALAAAEMLVCAPSYRATTYEHRSVLGPSTSTENYEASRRCTLLKRAFDAVDSSFSAPDTSFVTHLTPLADVTSLDSEIKARCLPILGAGSADPKLWDSAVRVATVILEERLRDVGGIADPGQTGRPLVNAIFGDHGTLAGEFSQDAERQGYRDLYAGVVGVFRNPYAHRLVDPAPENGGAAIVFVNLLLEMLEDLR
jgi:hypothetical protein